MVLSITEKRRGGGLGGLVLGTWRLGTWAASCNNSLQLVSMRRFEDRITEELPESHPIRSLPPQGLKGLKTAEYLLTPSEKLRTPAVREDIKVLRSLSLSLQANVFNCSSLP